MPSPFLILSPDTVYPSHSTIAVALFNQVSRKELMMLLLMMMTAAMATLYKTRRSRDNQMTLQLCLGKNAHKSSRSSQ